MTSYKNSKGDILVVVPIREEERYGYGIAIFQAGMIPFKRGVLDFYETQEEAEHSCAEYAAEAGFEVWRTE